MASRRILLEECSAEIVEKRSRFIATLKPVKTEEEAAAFFAVMKKKYWDARHNCTAFVVGQEPFKTRCSDDGEPSGTAGRPMLEVLTGSGICDAAVVVTRYFGGILLGTGGLVRAYSAAVKAAVDIAVTGVEREGISLLLAFPYGDEDRIRGYLKKNNVTVDSADYGGDVNLECRVAKEETERIKAELTELSDGRIYAEELGSCLFLDKEVGGQYH